MPLPFDIQPTWFQRGQLFMASTGSNTTASQTSGANLFNPNTAKNMLVFSIRAMNSGAGQSTLTEIRKVTSDPAFSNAITPVNGNLGSAATSLASSTWQASASPTGTPLDQSNFNTSSTQELLTNGKAILLPLSTNLGITVYHAQGGSGGLWSVTFSYIEY